MRLDFGALRRLSGLPRQPMAAFRIRAVAALQDFLDLGSLAAIESAGPDRLIVSRPVARVDPGAGLGNLYWSGRAGAPGFIVESGPFRYNLGV